MEERLPVSTSHPLFHHPGAPTGLPWCFPASLSPSSPAHVSFHIWAVYIFICYLLQHCFKLVTPLKPPPEICKIKTVKRGPPGSRAQLWKPGHGKIFSTFQDGRVHKSDVQDGWTGSTNLMEFPSSFLPSVSSCSWHVFWETLCLFTLLVVVLHVYL